MQIVENKGLVRRKLKIGNIANLASMALLVVGFVLSLMTDRLGNTAIFIAYGALIGAFLLLSYGRTFTRRWGPRFRQDQWLIPALRGVDNRYTMFNYASPKLPDHIVVGPGGLFVLVPKPNGGTIRFRNGRWSRGSVGSTLLRGLAEGGLGNPLIEVRKALTELAAYLRTHGSEELIQGLEARPIIVFTNPGARVEAKDPPVPIVHSKELRAIFRRLKPTLEPEKVEAINRVLGREVESE
ncbi:MAG: nuclease-related domain-containing protein [Sphingomonadaceae bacterium]